MSSASAEGVGSPLGSRASGSRASPPFSGSSPRTTAPGLPQLVTSDEEKGAVSAFGTSGQRDGDQRIGFSPSRVHVGLGLGTGSVLTAGVATLPPSGRVLLAPIRGPRPAALAPLDGVGTPVSPLGPPPRPQAQDVVRLNPLGMFFRSPKVMVRSLPTKTPGRTVMAVVMGLDDPTLRQPSTDAGTEAVDSMAAAAIQRTYRTHRSTVLAARFHVCAHQRQALLSETASPLLALVRALGHGVVMKSTQVQGYSLLACLAGAAAAVTALSVCASGTPAVTQAWTTSTSVAMALLLLVLQPAIGVLVWLRATRMPRVPSGSGSSAGRYFMRGPLEAALRIGPGSSYGATVAHQLEP